MLNANVLPSVHYVSCILKYIILLMLSNIILFSANNLNNATERCGTNTKNNDIYVSAVGRG